MPKRITRCPSCGEIFPLVGMDGLARCFDCDHKTLVVPIGASKYDKAYIDRYKDYESTNLGCAINEHRWFLVGLYNPPMSRILDYGCGAGAFVHSVSELKGYKVKGYDINPHSGFNDASLLGLEWDCVTMWDVIEHVENPMELVSSINAKRMFILTPDASCPTARQNIELWRHFRRDEHQHYFSPLSLTKMMERCGYRLIGMDRTEAMMRNPLGYSDLVAMWFDRDQK